MLRAKSPTDAINTLQRATDQAKDDRYSGQHEANTRNNARRETTVTLRSTACGGTINNKRQTICKAQKETAEINANLTRRGSAENPVFTL